MGDNYYFASDLHLGSPNPTDSLKREKHFIKWLDTIQDDCKGLFLVGDVFDFWHDYKYSVPRGHTRLLGKLAQLSDSGISIHIFPGNHDLWLYDYFEKELGIILERGIFQAELKGQKVYVHHGDGLGPGDHGYKFIKAIFTNSVCQFLFRWIHPDLGIPLARFFSKSSRDAGGDDGFLGEDNEYMIIHAKEILKSQEVDYFVFGHRHYPVFHKIEGATYVNLGDWIQHFSYAVLDDQGLRLESFPLNSQSESQ